MEEVTGSIPVWSTMNKFMKFKYLMIVVSAVVFLSAGCNKVSTNTNQSGTAPVQTASAQNVFVDTSKKISLDYSNQPVVTTAPTSYIPAQSNFPADGNNLLNLYLDPATYSGTNVESGWFNLAINQNLDKNGCYSATTGRTGVIYNRIRTVQGNAWYYSQPNPATDGAAGHNSSRETYRLFKNNMCYEVSLGISSFNRHNLADPDSVKDYDQQKLFGYLGAVFNQLKIQ